MTEKSKLFILYALIASSSLPFIAIMHVPLNWTLKNGALYVSAFCGYIGISLILWMYILGTRSVVGLFVKDVPRMIKVHNWLGTYGVLLIFLHPLLIGYYYGENLITYTLWPSLSNSFEKHVSYGRIGLIILLLIWVTSAILRGKIAYRPWKYLHYLSYAVLPLSFLHVPRIGSSFGEELVQLYWYGFIFLFLVITALRMRHLFGYGKQSYEVIEQKNLTPHVYVVRLRALQKNIHLKTGQYIYIQLGLLHEEHPFTVLDFSIESREITVAYKVYGSYTKKMAQLQVGKTVLIDGPYGTFTNDILVNPKVPSVFIAGGIGVTPFIKHIKDDVSNSHWMFYANRTKDTAVFRSYLKNKMGIKYVDIFSRDNSEAVVNEEHGQINEKVLARYLQAPSNFEYYICGPLGFINKAKNSLNILGVSPNMVHAEEFEF